MMKKNLAGIHFRLTLLVIDLILKASEWNLFFSSKYIVLSISNDISLLFLILKTTVSVPTKRALCTHPLPLLLSHLIWMYVWIPKFIFMWHLFLFLGKATLLGAWCTVIITDGLFQFIMTGKNNNESCKQEQALQFLYKFPSACQFKKQLSALAPHQKCKAALRLDCNSTSNRGRAKLAGCRA